MNRRGFLGGLLAALAAPAVITTPGLLMPVSTLALPTYGPGGRLTPAMIAADFSRILQGALSKTIIPGTKMHQQSCVDASVPTQDLALSLEDFRERYTRPAAHVMIGHIGNGSLAIGRIMEQPPHTDCAVHERAGVLVRALHAHDIWNDAEMLRFDVLHT